MEILISTYFSLHAAQIVDNKSTFAMINILTMSLTDHLLIDKR